MKNLSKVLAVVLAFAMALSMVSFAAYTDVAEDANYAKAVDVLSSLGILTGYEDGSFKPEATITRAEFATVVIRMLGLADSASGGAEIFTDVAADHWANGYVALAAQQGIVNGYGDGRFGPEDPVKYQEAIKMVVAALGYTPMADANGGYPGGYKVVASQKGILAGISGAKDNEAASRAIVAQLAYNSLAVPLMEQTGFGTQTNFQTVNMLLLNKLGVTKFEGVVDATALSSGIKAGTVEVTFNYQYTGVAGQGTAKKFDPASDNHIYCNPDLGGENTAKLIAKGAVEEAAKNLIDVASVMYVKDAGSDDAELVCILKDGNKNETVSFATEDIKGYKTAVTANNGTDTTADDDGYKDDTADGVIEVYTDKDAGETEEYTLNIGKVYINGRTNALDESNTKIASATQLKAALDNYVQYSVGGTALHNDVTLLSTEEDEFNVAYITTYTDVQVTRIADRSWKVIYDTIPGAQQDVVILDETDKNQSFEIYKDGEIASFEDIKEDDVLSIAGYKDSNDKLVYGKVYIVTEKVEGKVTAKTTGKVSVDGTVYKTTIASNAINLGDTAVFFKNYRGLLVAVDATATAANVKYGFATYLRKYDADYGDPAQIRLMNTEGKWETLYFADQVTINGTFKTASKNINWTDATFNNTYIPGDDIAGVVVNGVTSSAKFGYNDIVAYDLNTEGKISKIYFTTVTDVFEPTTVNDTKEFDGDTYVFEDIYVDDATVIFNLATNFKANRTLDTDESDVTILAVSALADGTDYNLLTSYDADDSDIVGAVLGYDMAAGIDYADNFFVITEVPMEATNEAGEAGIILEGIKAGEEVTLFINTEDPDCDLYKATYDVAKVGDDYATIADTLAAEVIDDNGSDFGKGDVLIFTLNGKGEAARIEMLVDASAVATDSAQAYNKLASLDLTGNNDTILAVEEGNTTYKFVAGYALEFRAGKLVLTAVDETEKTYAFASDAVGAKVDAYTGEGSVKDAMSADIETDDDAALGNADTNKGDYVFAKVVGTRIVEFVTIANMR